MYSAIFLVEPVAKGRPRFTRTGHAYTPEKTRKAEEELRWLMLAQKPREVYDLPIAVTIAFHLPRPKTSKLGYPARVDLDNLCKTVKDAGNGILWKDDSLICVLRAAKIYGDPPRIVIQIAEL